MMSRLRVWWYRNRFFLLRNLMFGVFVVFFALFWVGFHNADLMQNLRWINAEYGLDLHDMSMNGKVWDDRSGYILGMCQIVIGFFVSFLSYGQFCWFSCKCDSFERLPDPPPPLGLV